MLTHDWPLHIYKMPGARDYLLRKKPFFKEDIDNHKLGSPMYELLINKLKPVHWFSAHLHVRFQTNYIHQSITQSRSNDQKDSIKNDANKINDKSTIESNKNFESTHFLALDKCLFRRPYLEVINVQSDEFNTDGLEYDLEWLSILKVTDEYVSTQEYPPNLLPQPHRIMNYDLDTEKEKIKEIFKNKFQVPKNFTISMPFNLVGEDVDPERVNNYTNEQTTKFCKLLEITDPMQRIVHRVEGKIMNPDKIDISDCEEADWKEEVKVAEPDQSNSNDVSTTVEDVIVGWPNNSEEININQSVDNESNNESSNEPSAKRVKEEPLFFIDTQGQN